VFKVNDYVIYGSTGVCKITDIQIDNCDISNNTEDYYILRRHYDDNITIKIPVKQESALLRPIMSKDDVLAMIAAMPEKEIILIEDERQRSITLRNALKTGSNEEKIRIIKTLHLERERKATSNKKLNRTDEQTINTAEKQLYEEFAVALNISPEDVLPYILEHIPPTKEKLV
jgi:CarD family transcriptional regulator